jgi:TIR domain
MPYAFLLSYAHADAQTDGPPAQPDGPFATFLQRLNQRVKSLTGRSGFVDRTDIRPGQDWPDELAEALRVAETMVCLYSPSYFQSEHCGKEMQVFLDRRRNYVRANGGKRPANIIPVLWHPVPRRIPTSLPKIEYAALDLKPNIEGVWNLGDQGRDRDLKDFADEIAIRVRDAADETPLPPLANRPRMNAVRSAFYPPPLPLPEFDALNATGGPDTVTFVYLLSARWNTWPWAPPDEQAVLHLAASVAKGNEMEATQLTFSLADATWIDRLASLRQRNNVVILFVDATSLDLEDLRARLREYDRSEHSTFAVIVIINNLVPEFEIKLNETLPYFSRRSAPHLYFADTRENFCKSVAEALDGLRLTIVNNPQAPNVIGNPTEFQRLPAIGGPGRPQIAS